MRDPALCTDCGKDCSKEFLTEINPEGGFGRAAVRVCDDCMRSGRWDGWRARHWSTWPLREIK